MAFLMLLFPPVDPGLFTPGLPIVADIIRSGLTADFGSAFEDTMFVFETRTGGEDRIVEVMDVGELRLL